MGLVKERKIIYIMAISMILGGCSSGAKDEPVKKQEQVVTVTDTPTQLVLDENSMKKQLDIIVQNRAEWMKAYPEDVVESYFYTVADLDGNGRLEFIISSCQGSGCYTSTECYEVNEAMDGLDLIDKSEMDGDAEPDLIVDEAVRYLEESTGIRTYIMSDFGQSGITEQYENVSGLSLQNGKLVNEMIGKSLTQYDVSGNSTQNYKNSKDQEITQEEFGLLAENRYAGQEMTTVRFSWNESVKREDMEALTEEELLQRLADSYHVFAGE